MHLESTINQLKEMRLSVMAESLEHTLSEPSTRELSHEEFVSLLVENEYVARKNRKINRMLGRAGFKPEMACMEDIRYSIGRGLDKKQIHPFSTTQWIKNSQNLILTGPTGSGKTYIAEAISNRACRNGYPALKIRYKQLFDEIEEARGTGQFSRYLSRMEKIKVLILDDFVMSTITPSEQAELMDILEHKDQRASIIITTQYPIKNWHERFPDPTMADAICDRLIHKAYKINLKGESQRKSSDPV
jgi:DNA replication protein DnaC